MSENTQNLVKREEVTPVDVPMKAMNDAYSIAAIQNMANDLVRTRRIPYDKKSVFNTYNEMTDYIDDVQTTSYPGMVISIIGRDEPRKGVYVLMSNGTTLIPTPIGGSTGSTGSIGGSCGTNCCVWVSDTANAITKGWILSTFAEPTEEQLATLGESLENEVALDGGVTAYRVEIPEHDHTSDGTWVGKWNNWVIKNTDGTTINPTFQEFGSDKKWTLRYDTDEYVSDAIEMDGSDITAIIVKKGDEKFIAVRTWIND